MLFVIVDALRQGRHFLCQIGPNNGSAVLLRRLTRGDRNPLAIADYLLLDGFKLDSGEELGELDVEVLSHEVLVTHIQEGFLPKKQ